MIQSLLALRQSNTGFDLSNVLTMEGVAVATRYQTPAQTNRIFTMQRFSGSVHFRASRPRPPSTTCPCSTARVKRSRSKVRPRPRSRIRLPVQVRQITRGYLETMRIPLLRGRNIARSDSDVLPVSREAAKLYWGTDDPIGRRAALPMILAPDVQRGRRDCRRRQAARPCGQLHTDCQLTTGATVSWGGATFRDQDIGSTGHAGATGNGGNPRD